LQLNDWDRPDDRDMERDHSIKNIHRESRDLSVYVNRSRIFKMTRLDATLACDEGCVQPTSDLAKSIALSAFSAADQILSIVLKREPPRSPVIPPLGRLHATHLPTIKYQAIDSKCVSWLVKSIIRRVVGLDASVSAALRSPRFNTTNS